MTQQTGPWTSYASLGPIHGAWFATLLDSALGCAVQATLESAAPRRIVLVRATTARRGRKGPMDG